MREVGIDITDQIPKKLEYVKAVHDAQRGGFADTDRIALAKRQPFVGMTRARDLLWLGTI